MKLRKEIVMYIIFGVLTTGVNYITYLLASRFLSFDVMLANGIAFFAAVIFAYRTNRKYVFFSDTHLKTARIKELASFFAARISTFVLDMFMMYLFVEIWLLNDVYSKLVVNALVIVINYILSKFIVFRKIKE